LKELHETRKFCDLKFRFADHEVSAHRAVLIAASHGFQECIDEWEKELETLQQFAIKGEVGEADRAEKTLSGCVTLEQPESGLAIMIVGLDALLEVDSKEAVDIVLAHAYGVDGDAEYKPECSKTNKDVLRMADKFKLDQLKVRAVQWMSQMMTEDRIIEWLELCDKFGLMDLMDHILETLTEHEKGLQCVERQSTDFAKVPWISNELLKRHAASKLAELQKPKKPAPEPVVVKKSCACAIM
jgi:hypothetical protein